MRTAAFSIISPNYRAPARVLMESLRAHHPEWERFVLVVDASSPSHNGEPFTTIPFDALDLPHPRRFCFRYNLLELNTAVKPWVFAHLFERGYDRVVYFDPDVWVFSALSELDDSFVTLTPHLTAPFTGGVHRNERSVLLAGTYNLGFLSVTRGPHLASFLEWWQKKLEFHCVVDTGHGLFVDQKWMDLVPGLFPGVSILRHDGYNAGWWNFFQRTIARDGAGFTVNGVPLRFYHFSGFDPRTPWTVSRHGSPPRLDGGDVAQLFERYAAAMQAAGHDSYRDAPYAFAAFADGSLIHDAARFAYRDSSELQSKCGDDPFAHPELFRRFRDPGGLSAKAAVWAYRLLLPVRPLARLLPRRMQNAVRQFLLRQQGSALN